MKISGWQRTVEAKLECQKCSERKSNHIGSISQKLAPSALRFAWQNR